MTHKQLPVPHSATSDPKAIELLRVWAAHGEQHVSLVPGIWKDPASWGIMLVDLAKHVARAYEESSGLEYELAIQRIRQGIDAEWQDATDTPIGKLVD
ncbi:MAG: DUF5076 domain-containing protein [Planctomycetota bacterium]|nr:DUF5076 domain-containing protein [Planctomycetota bacterium]